MSTLEERKAKKEEIQRLIAEAAKKLDEATAIADDYGLYFEARLFNGGPMKYAGKQGYEACFYDKLEEQFILMDEFKKEGRIHWDKLFQVYPDAIQIEFPGWNASSVGC